MAVGMSDVTATFYLINLTLGDAMLNLFTNNQNNTTQLEDLPGLKIQVREIIPFKGGNTEKALFFAIGGTIVDPLSPEEKKEWFNAHVPCFRNRRDLIKIVVLDKHEYSEGTGEFDKDGKEIMKKVKLDKPELRKEKLRKAKVGVGDIFVIDRMPKRYQDKNGVWRSENRLLFTINAKTGKVTEIMPSSTTKTVEELFK